MPSEGDTGLLIQELIYSGLEAVRAVMPIDLCAYLHTTGDHGPQLFLATPDLSSIGPTEAFSLFNSLRDALQDPQEGAADIRLGAYNAVAVPTGGSRSRGLHVAGRKSAPLEPLERDTVVRLARSLGAVVHSLEDAASAVVVSAAPIRVSVEMGESRSRAEVWVPVGPEIRLGVADSTTPSRAVAEAVLDAVAEGLKLSDTAEGQIAGERAVLALVSDQSGRLALGSSLIGEREDALQAAAAATLEAALRLRSGSPSS